LKQRPFPPGEGPLLRFGRFAAAEGGIEEWIAL